MINKACLLTDKDTMHTLIYICRVSSNNFNMFYHLYGVLLSVQWQNLWEQVRAVVVGGLNSYCNANENFIVCCVGYGEKARYI